MVANPQKAIEKATSAKKLAEILDEILKPWYPNSDVVGWLGWVSKYKSLDMAKKSATAMYDRKRDARS